MLWKIAFPKIYREIYFLFVLESVYEKLQKARFAKKLQIRKFLKIMIWLCQKEKTNVLKEDSVAATP